MTLNPITMIWFHPSQTIKYLISHKYKITTTALAIGYGIVYNLPGLFPVSDEFDISLFMALVILLVFGAIFGLISIYIRSWILKVLGKFFALSAHSTNIRIGIVWSQWPIIIGSLLSFTIIEIEHYFQLTSTVSTTVVNAIDLTSWIWMLALLVPALSVVFKAEKSKVFALLFFYIALVELPLNCARLLFL